jgi:hypothetical protein
MKTSDSIAKLAASLVAAQTDIKAVAKDSSNPDFRSKYASLDAIIEQVRPALARHGLAVLQGATTPDRDEAGHVAAFSVETMLVHTSGEFITNAVVVPVVGRMLKGGGMGDVTPQSAGSALSYGRRYGIAALLSIATEEDDDGNRASAPVAQRSGATRAPSPAPAAPVAAADTPESVLMPFGKKKGQPLGELDEATLVATITWATKTDATKFADLIANCQAVINRRAADVVPF